MGDTSPQPSIYEDALASVPQDAPSPIDDSDTKTIRPTDADRRTPSSAFGFAFEEFQLDLSCLSAPPSPSPSGHQPLPEDPSDLPPSRPGSPRPSIQIARSTSFGAPLPSISLKLSTKKASAPQLSSTPSKSNSRGSWPLNKSYAGKGTPIDRNRRHEWAGMSRTDVSEDGILASLRSSSLDLGFRPLSRPGSPEWRTNVPVGSTRSNSTASESFGPPVVIEPPPALAPLAIGGDKPDEWDSIIKTVLASVSEKPEGEDLGDGSPQETENDSSPSSSGPWQHGDEAPQSPQDTIVATPIMSRSQERTDVLHGLDIDLGLNSALDLGLGQKGGVNWFNLGLTPTSACGGTDTPSVYSQPHTPQISPLPSARPSQSGSRPPPSPGGQAPDYISSKGNSTPWWRRIARRFRKVQTLISVIHKHSP